MKELAGVWAQRGELRLDCAELEHQAMKLGVHSKSNREPMKVSGKGSSMLGFQEDPQDNNKPNLVLQGQKAITQQKASGFDK